MNPANETFTKKLVFPNYQIGNISIYNEKVNSLLARVAFVPKGKSNITHELCLKRENGKILGFFRIVDLRVDPENVLTKLSLLGNIFSVVAQPENVVLTHNFVNNRHELKILFKKTHQFLELTEKHDTVTIMRG